MAHSTRPNIRAALRPLGGLAFAGLIVSCASTPSVPKGYPLGNGGKPLAHPGTVCVQIGPLNAPQENQGQCYQLVPPGSEHVEALPLDEFGYLYPPLKPGPKPATVIAVPPTVAAPPTTAPAPVTRTATPVFTTKIVAFSTKVPFKLNSAQLGPTNRAAITAFVNSLERYHGVIEIQVTGHTDRSGSQHFNQWLSRIRAQSVQLHLLALGLDPRHIRLQGAGSSEPRAHTRSGAANRYVDIQVTVRVPKP